jgi:pre-mRNA-splicing factor CWC26
MEWGKGMVQKKLRAEKLESDVYEAQKPLARYIDDTDLDKMMREQEREDDPMLQYIKKSIDKESGVEKKEYKGPAPAPNRFKIKPGYRWDGVDRSNGFEKKYFESLSQKKAFDVERYKWSVEDL